MSEFGSRSGSTKQRGQQIEIRLVYDGFLRRLSIIATLCNHRHREPISEMYTYMRVAKVDDKIDNDILTCTNP